MDRAKANAAQAGDEIAKRVEVYVADITGRHFSFALLAIYDFDASRSS